LHHHNSICRSEVCPYLDRAAFLLFYFKVEKQRASKFYDALGFSARRFRKINYTESRSTLLCGPHSVNGKSRFIYSLPYLSKTLPTPLCEDASSLHAALLNGDCFHAHNKMERPETSIFLHLHSSERGIELGLESIAPYLQRNVAREPFFSALSKSSFTKRRQAHYFPSDME
jgi:hypothetical protein